MASDEELKKIKKKYGEKFMHMCRDLFPTILEQEGALFAILENTFASNSKSLYEDIQKNDLEGKFKKFIQSKANIEHKGEEVVETKTPYELLNEAGYDLYECTTEEEIQKFKKYFASDEELCTFRGGRLKRCLVFFAVKKNVDDIKRENFKKPLREDEYGTSVMSIQFYKEGKSSVSIKNRYNHTVRNPDATYGNDLDRIIPGLSKSFEKLLSERGLEFENGTVERFGMPNYIMAGDGRFYKYNLEFLGRYYCPGNVIIDFGDVVELGNPEKQILVDKFLIDLKGKSISHYSSFLDTVDMSVRVYADSFPDTFRDGIEKIEVVRDTEAQDGERIIRVKKKDTDAKIEIRINRDNQMIEYINEEVEEVQKNFLRNSFYLKRLILPNLKTAGDNFLFGNEVLEYLDASQLRKAGNDFLNTNLGLTVLDLPELVRASHSFVSSNLIITDVNLPKLEVTGNNFMVSNCRLKKLVLPELQETGGFFLGENQMLEYLFAPNLEIVSSYFLGDNINLLELELPSLRRIGEEFLSKNKILRRLKVKDVEALKGASNKRLLSIAEDDLVTPKKLAKLDDKSGMTEFEIRLGEMLTKMRKFIKRDR